MGWVEDDEAVDCICGMLWVGGFQLMSYIFSPHPCILRTGGGKNGIASSHMTLLSCLEEADTKFDEDLSAGVTSKQQIALTV